MQIPVISDLISRHKSHSKEKKIQTLLLGGYQSPSLIPSILHLSLNKAATQFVKMLLKENAVYNNLKFVDYHGYFFDVGHPFFDNMTKDEFSHFHHAFQPKGFVYSSFGGPLPYINDLDTYRKLVIIRDPRDILTSQYYSSGFSHAIPRDPHQRMLFLKRRSEVINTSIDEFVLIQMYNLHTQYIRYIDFLSAQKHNVFFYKYEDLVQFPERFLLFMEHQLGFGIRNKPKYLKSLEPKVGENKFDHKRKMIPGDYKEKLSGMTIGKLNQMFDVVLNHFGYQL